MSRNFHQRYSCAPWHRVLTLLALLTGCSQAAEPKVLGIGGTGAAGAGDLDFGNPKAPPRGGNDGGSWDGGDGMNCAPDQEVPCGSPSTPQRPQEPQDASVPDGSVRDGGMIIAQPDAGQGPRPDAAVARPDATVPAPDGAVIDPPDPGEPGDSDAGEEPAAATYKIDLLFVVDNSGSMREEQIALREQFPRLITRLLADTAIGGGSVVAGAQDIQLGIVSTDLGLPGVSTIPDCSGLGDNGELRSLAASDVLGCSATTFTPRFLSYVAGRDDAAQTATDLGCLATLGTTGCGFEQQLESALKAVWPADDPRVTFLHDPATGFGATGQAGPTGPNGAFVRHDPTDPSVLAIVIVTDEEDCSSSRTSHLRSAVELPAGDPLQNVGLNVRCLYEDNQPEPNGLYDLIRYANAFRFLRTSQEHLVVFGAIAGVPPELVTPAQLAAVDFHDAASRNGFYDRVLAHPSMQHQIDDRGTADTADDSLVPSCVNASGTARAYPPRRIVEVARALGAGSFVQSICADDWSPAIDLLARRIAEARQRQ